MPEMTDRTVELLGQTVPYELRESEDATEPRIDVDINGVAVVLPADSTERPNKLLKENANWVIEKKEKYDTYREQIPERRFEAGETFPYLGEPHEIRIEQRSASAVSDGEFRLAAHHVEETSVKRALETLYRRKARERFERRVEELADEMGVEYDQLQIRNQRTKWGSCSTSGTIGLNWRLLMAPPEIIDYIIVHELAHLQEPNHTDAFWALVSQHDPECQDHAAWLEEHGTTLVFSDEDL